MNSRTVRIGNVSVPIPDNLSQALADEIAQRLTLRLQEIEAEAGRVDTLRYAFQLSLESALQLREHLEARQREDAQVARALKALNDLLEQHLRG